jgi:hypothetical protein
VSAVADARDGRTFALAAAHAEFDARPLWRAQERGPAGWDEETKLCKRLASDLAGVAGEALRRAGLAGPLRAGCTVGTLYGFGHVAEGIDARLAAKGPAWLEPEAFVYYPAHVVAALACVELGLRGSAATLTGPRSGGQALEQALRSLRLGRHQIHLAGAYEAISPAAAGQLESLGVSVEAGRAEAAFVVLVREGSGGVAPPDAGTPAEGVATPIAARDADGAPPTLLPFLDLARQIAANGAVPVPTPDPARGPTASSPPALP